MKKVLQNIFSVKNIEPHKVITICGLKIKFKNKFRIIKQQISDLQRENVSNNLNINNQILENRDILYRLMNPPLYDNEGWERQYLAKFLEELKDLDFKNSYQNLIKNLDNKSIETVNKIVARAKLVQDKNIKWFDIFTNEEIYEIKKISQNFWQKIIKFDDNCFGYDKYFLPINHFEICVFKNKHEIESLNKDYFKDKDIIDAGGFIGDSAIVFSDYTNKNVHTFEPTKENYSNMLKTIELNNKTNIIPNNVGFGDENKKTDIFYCGPASGLYQAQNFEHKEEIQLIALDKYVEENNLNVGLIKTDLEGFEQPFLKGAENTIKTQKPTLLISIYHSADDFFKIKSIIESWNLGYKFRIVKPIDGQILLETVLIAEIEPITEK